MKTRTILYLLAMLIMMYLFIIYIVPILILSLCLFDYTDEVRDLAKPLQDNYMTFYEKNKRPPSSVEEDIFLLRKAGCTDVTIKWPNHSRPVDFNCIFSGRKYAIFTSVSHTINRKHRQFHSFQNSCAIVLNTDGSLRVPFNCYNDRRDIEKPLTKKYKDFYKQNNRVPDHQEEITMLNEIGCTEIKMILSDGDPHSFSCYFSGYKYWIDVDVSKNIESFADISIHKSRCVISFDSNGNPEATFCQKTGCIHPSH